MSFMCIQGRGVIRKPVCAILKFDQSSWNSRAVSIEMRLKFGGKYKPIGIVKRVCNNLIKTYGRETYKSNGILLENIVYTIAFLSFKALIYSLFGYFLIWYTLYFTCNSFSICTSSILSTCYIFPYGSNPISPVILPCLLFAMGLFRFSFNFIIIYNTL